MKGRSFLLKYIYTIKNMEILANRFDEGFKLYESAEKYTVDVEVKYNKAYNDALSAIMKSSTPTQSERIQAAKKIYDGKVFVNSGGITYTLTVNPKAKTETEVISVHAKKGNQEQTKTISGANVPFMVG